jgi:hypothetical protein
MVDGIPEPFLLVLADFMETAEVDPNYLGK